jgi:hypothetical protein
MSDYAKAARAKGWTIKALAERWGLTPRRLNQIGKEPTQRDWDALAGVPNRFVTE